MQTYPYTFVQNNITSFKGVFIKVSCSDIVKWNTLFPIIIFKNNFN